MSCEYSKYFNDLIKENLNKNQKSELLEHASCCPECSRKLKAIEDIDKMIVASLGEPTFESRKQKIIAAVRNKKKSFTIGKFLSSSHKLLYAVSIILILAILIVILENYSQPQKPAADTNIKSNQMDINEHTDNIKEAEITGAIAKVIELQREHANAANYGEYIIHDNYYYVPTGQTIKRSEADKLLGTVTRIGDWEIKKEGDTPCYIPSTKYYSIKGVPEQGKIACENGMNSKTKVESDYLELERREPVGTVNKDEIFSVKNDTESVDAALENLREYIPFLHEFVSDDLKPTLVYTVDKSSGNKTSGYILMYYLKKDTQNDDIQSYIFVRQYEADCDPWEGVIRVDPKTGQKLITEFDYDPDKKLSSFTMNGINWEEYQALRENASYFRGTIGSVIFEISSQELSSDQVKQYLSAFLNTK